MMIAVPEALTSRNSLEYIVSIRLLPDGLSFSGYHPNQDGSFFYREVKFDSTSPYRTNLKNCFFENECLSRSYRETQIVCVSKYTLVPSPFYDENQKTRWMDLCHMETEGQVLADTLQDDQAKLIYRLDESVWAFCVRSFANVKFSHYLSALSRLWLRESATDEGYKRMYVVVEGKRLDIACVEQGQLRFMNTFSGVEEKAFLYYILYVWKQMGLSSEHDQLLFYANTVQQASLLDHLKVYLRKAHTMDIPTGIYTRGTDLFKAPMDIIALAL